MNTPIAMPTPTGSAKTPPSVQKEDAMWPSPWYGTCSITVSQPYLWRISSNHFMKVKQPV
jgi:hypothetical protein